MTHPLADPLMPTKVGRDQMIQRAVLRFASAAELAGFDLAFGAAVSGAVLVGGRLFEFDAADLISAPDGIAVVVDAGGRRYKAADLAAAIDAVQSTTVTSPPVVDATTWGRSWIVPIAATGDWAAHPSDIAVSTARGWIYVPARVGRIVYDAATDGHFVFRVDGLWHAGLGSPSAGTVRPEALEFPVGFSVVSRTITAPPAGSTRAAYIVPAGATGDWSAHVGAIAIGSSAAGWSYLAAPEGGEVYVIAEARKLRYSGGAWSAGADALASVRRAAEAASIAPTGTYAYSATAPTASNTSADGLTITHPARAASNIVWVRYQAVVSTTATTTPTFATVALFIDGAAVASQWLPVTVEASPSTISVEFLVTVADAASHLYAIRWGTGTSAVAARTLILQEVSVL